MSQIDITYGILILVVALFVSNLVPVDVVAIGAALALWATGVLTLNQSLAGFGDPTVLFIASLFVVSEGLDATGVTAWAGQRLIAAAGTDRTRLLLLTMALVAALTALISVNGAVAALLPVVVVIAIRLQVAPSKLLLPLVFGAHAGSMLALTGTPVNVLVSEAAMDATGQPFGFFQFTLVGVPLVIGAMAIVALFGERLLPTRTPQVMLADLSQHARTIVEQYALAGNAFQLRVRTGSALVGANPTSLDIGDHPDVAVVGTRSGRDGGRIDGPVAVGDQLMVRGDPDAVAALALDQGLSFREDGAPDDMADALLGRTSGVAEVVIPPRSALIGTAAFPGMVTPSGDLVILAVQRRGEDQAPAATTLAAGDILLLQGTWKALDEHLGDPEVLVVDDPRMVRRQAVPLGAGAWTAIAILTGMVVLLATGVVPGAVAGLLAAGAMVILRVLTVQDAYRAISWTTIVLVGAMIPLSTAMIQTGAADAIAHRLIDIVGGSGPYALLAGLFLLTATLGQLISNMATALIVIPIAVSAAVELHVSPVPVLMSVTVAAAASFLTPVATPVNMMVMGPAGYRFGDYWKLGILFMALFFAVAVFLVPVFWAF